MAIIIKRLEQNAGKIELLIIYAFITFFLMVNAGGLFSEWNQSWTFNVIIYSVGVLLFVVAVDELPLELRTPLHWNIIYFCASVLITITVLFIIKDFKLMFHNIPPMPAHLILGTMVFNLVPVAISEELIFRGVIFGWLYDRFKLRPEKQTKEIKTWGWIIPYFVSAFSFTIFHYAVYGLDLTFTPILFFMGIIFNYVTERFGIGASIGAHWIWNCFSLGLIYIGIPVF